MAHSKKGGFHGPCHAPPKATKANSPMIHGPGGPMPVMPPDGSGKHEWHAAKTGAPMKHTARQAPKKTKGNYQ